MKRKIIGHRGAAGLELENTATSLRRAAWLDLYAVEFDLRLTKDERLVLCHDADLQFLADDKRLVSSLTLSELKKIPLVDGSTILSLEEALEITEGVRTIIEMKDHGSAHLVLNALDKYPNGRFIVISSKLDELALLRELAPKLNLYSVEHTKPIESIHFARRLQLNGIAMNYWLLNPLTYWFARRSKLELYVYTVNSKLLADLLGWLYPDVGIATDHPELFVKRRRTIRKKRKDTDRKAIRAQHLARAKRAYNKKY